MQHDPDRPEDLDTDGEDHVADDSRYACMSRPWLRQAAESDKPDAASGYRALRPDAEPGDWRAY